MKRLWVALAISVLVAYFCVVSAKDVNHSIQEMLDQLSVALQAVLDQDLELAKQKTSEICEMWDRWSPIGNMYIHHNELEPIPTLLTAMDENLKSGILPSYMVASQQVAGILNHIIQTEMPSLSNIL